MIKKLIKTDYIKADYFKHYFIRVQNDTKRAQKKIMQATNCNKRFATF